MPYPVGLAVGQYGLSSIQRRQAVSPRYSRLPFGVTTKIKPDYTPSFDDYGIAAIRIRSAMTAYRRLTVGCIAGWQPAAFILSNVLVERLHFWQQHGEQADQG